MIGKRQAKMKAINEHAIRKSKRRLSTSAASAKRRLASEMRRRRVEWFANCF